MDFILLIKAIVSLLFVLGLLFLTLWAIKYIELHSASSRFFKKINGKKRLEIVEIKRIDARNTLVLVRRDNQEHLLLIGPSSQIIENNIPAQEQNNEGQNHDKED